MKSNKLAVSGLALVGMTLTTGLAAVPTMAATPSGITMAATHIYLDGQNISNPDHVVAKDPWGGSTTTWVPIYYLQQVLKKAGFQTSWNGTALTFVSTPSGWVAGAALGNPEAQPLTAPQGQMQVTLVDGSAPSMNIPKIVTKDPASGVATTYAPIYYIDQVLNKYWMMHATWNGFDWKMVTQQNSPITKQTYSTSSDAANAVESIDSNFSYMKFNSGSVNLGEGITAQSEVNTGKQGDNGYQWHEGNWTIDVLYYTNNNDGEQVAKNVVSYLHTHMLPAPNTKGVIVIQSTNSNSSTMASDTTIAWQEGNKVYQLQRPGDPVSALTAVVNQSTQKSFSQTFKNSGSSSQVFLTPSIGFQLTLLGGGASNFEYQFSKTTDGGQTWTNVSKHSYSHVRGISFVSDNTGFLLNNSPAYAITPDLFVTHDGGVTWVEQKLPIPSMYTNAYRSSNYPIFFSPTTGFIPVYGEPTQSSTTTEFLYMLVTTDGGKSWTAYTKPQGDGLSWNLQDQTLTVTNGTQTITIDGLLGGNWNVSTGN